MHFIELLLLSLSLAMDCFAVSCSAGVTQPKLQARYVLFFAFCFGFFQALMPLIGWLGGEVVVGYISRFADWIAFIILAVIGGKMVFESIHGDESDAHTDMTKLGTVMLLSVATSIDALAVGFSFSMMQNVRIGWSIFWIGLVSFLVSLLGFILSKRFCRFVKANVAECIGGVVLICIGLKILIF